MDALGIDNFILWSKGWYKCLDENRDSLQIVKDIMALDDYPYCQNWGDILSILYRKIDLYNKWLINNNKEHDVITFEKLHYNTESIFNIYHYKGMPYEEIIVHAIRSILAWDIDKEIKLRPPHYDKALRKKGYALELKQGMSYKEMNQRVKSVFKDK